ncbi:MAG: hypothetical protein ACTHK7_17925 [Aureliella sp.]
MHRQLKWFDKLASLSTEVRPEILSAESLAVWAPYTSARRCSFDKDSRDGGHLAGHIGRLLASVIEAGGPTAENVFDTLRLSALGRHPQSMFSAQVAWAFAESSSGEAQQLLEECFFSAATPRERCTVLYAATESESDVLARILERALAENTLLDEAVHRVWYRWFGYDISFMAALPVEAIHEFFGEVVPLMRSPLELHLAAQSDMWPRQALAAWVTAMGDSDLALEQFERLAVHEECRARALAVRLTGALTREAGVPIIERGLTDSELKNAVDALEVLDPWAESFESSDARHRRWDLVHKLARRIDEAPADSDIGGTFAWGRIKSQLARCWQNESLETLDGLLDRRLNGRWLLPKDYVLTDQYSIN